MTKQLEQRPVYSTLKNRIHGIELIAPEKCILSAPNLAVVVCGSRMKRRNSVTSK